MDKNRIEGVAEQGERAMNRKALVVKAERRKSGGCAGKECVLTWGDLALRLKGRRKKNRSEKSAEAVVATALAKGQTRRSVKRLVDETCIASDARASGAGRRTAG
jgi:transposase-like protein